MPRSAHRIVECLLLCALATETALAADLRSGTPLKPAPTAGAQPPGAQSAPLKGTLRMAPNARPNAIRAMPSMTLDTLNKKFMQFSGNAKQYEQGAKAMPTIAAKCSAKAYTVQDQMAAGCVGNDTLNQCMAKLYKYCVEHYATSDTQIPLPQAQGPVAGAGGGGGGSFTIPGFSTKQFQQSAQLAAAEARALSAALSQYANEVEQNAKALVP